jgi:hypothetical protein
MVRVVSSLSVSLFSSSGTYPVLLYFSNRGIIASILVEKSDWDHRISHNSKQISILFILGTDAVGWHGKHCFTSLKRTRLQYADLPALQNLGCDNPLAVNGSFCSAYAATFVGHFITLTLWHLGLGIRSGQGADDSRHRDRRKGGWR